MYICIYRFMSTGIFVLNFFIYNQFYTFNITIYFFFLYIYTREYNNIIIV